VEYDFQVGLPKPTFRDHIFTSMTSLIAHHGDGWHKRRWQRVEFFDFIIVAAHADTAIHVSLITSTPKSLKKTTAG